MKNFELSIFIDAEDRGFGGWRISTADAETGFLFVVRTLGEESLITDLPAWARFYGIGAEENIHCCDCLLGIGSMPFGRALEPDASRARFPTLGTLVLFRSDWVETTNTDVNYDSVSFSQLGLLFPFNVYVGVIQQPTGEVKIFLYAVPFLCI